MIEIDSALSLFNKYGYSSITTHPYIYQSGDSLGICYTYEDEDFGTGMGMWIVRKTALEYDGDIDLSENKKLKSGFKTTISFGGKYV